MNQELQHQWLCPLCQLPLHLNDKIWQCENQHMYDRAKEGYVNLLLAQHRKSKNPGDSKAMVNARRLFLDSGAYAPLAAKLAETLLNQSQYLNANENFKLFDAGCGEGYYLRTIAQHFLSQKRPLIASGIDIAKPAIQKAAKRSSEHHFAVGSSFALPLNDNQQDAVLQVFAPSSASEIRRILKPSGLWIIVDPAAEHLAEIKAMIYDEVVEHQANTYDTTGFEYLGEHQVTFGITMDNAEIRESLLMMTPYYWHVSEDKKANILAKLDHATADFKIQVWQKG
ncbi:methyltransferase domain-containing protein [Alteromonas sp. ASW11-36]|uniref:Methyltransferase domain-containing protein n=1 Tax=Alteromonas arenosi TaxID=3055817 RepID=A0ABT7SYG2_9ALTE|nr:methyltransferase domain-containing protein [Alteromonas sp. ASW11-36]MDM7861228.1 methyltransferase domain-containing protein [Alteromonas sp. ASW11-36]